MSSFWRFTLLGLFGAAGVGLALCVAASSPSAGASVADPSAAGGSGETRSVVDNQSQKPAAATIAPPTGTPTARIVEPIQPRIAAQATFDNPTDSTNPALSLAQSTGAPALGQPSQMTQAEVIDQLRQQMQRALQSKQDIGGGPAELPALQPAGPRRGNENPTSLPVPPPPAPGILPTPGNPVDTAKSKPRITRIPGDEENNLSIHIQDSDLRDVLELLSEQGGLNILPSPTVQGKVSASLNGVDIDTALHAILRSTGYIARRDGQFIYVGTPKDFKDMEQAADTIGSRVYHINYVRAADIKALVTPLLTPQFGSISETPPAEQGIAPDNTKAGGDQFAGGETILVRDFMTVLDEIDQVISEVDHRPAQVAIEAMILRVTLNDKYSFGVDFELLRQNPTVRLATGSPLPPVAPPGDFDFSQGGLKFAFLNGSTNAFVQALETMGDTNVIASPRLMVVDKARAEILIGQQLGYVNTTITETSTAQNVQFLEVGAQLRLRPFISSDGLIRMEVHPELSTGEVTVQQGLTLPNKDTTQVTTNIMVPDGATVIIGGLMREDLSTDANQIPLLGSLPGIGFLFRHKNETQQKEEIIVLITPHIVCDADAACEGDKSAAEFHRRQAVYADQMSHLGKRYLGRRYYRLAQAAWAHHDQQAALRFIDLAIHFDPENRAAIELRVDIWNGNLVGDHTLLKPDAFASPGVPGGAPGWIAPDNEMPELAPMPRGFESLPPGRPASQDSNDVTGRRSNPGGGNPSRTVTKGEPTLATAANIPPLKAPAAMARKTSNAPTPDGAKSSSIVVPGKQPPDGDHPPTADGIDLRSANIPAKSALDGPTMPNWMVDNLMQTSATAR
jgi:type IV pilus assembly protein PilQ